MSTSDGRSAIDGWSVKVLIGVHLGLGIWFPGRLSRAVSSFSLFIYFFIFLFFLFLWEALSVLESEWWRKIIED